MAERIELSDSGRRTSCIATRPDSVPLKPPQILKVDVRGRSAMALYHGVKPHLQLRLNVKLLSDTKFLLTVHV